MVRDIGPMGPGARRPEGLTHREIFETQVKERIPLEAREQTPVDIGHAVAYLVSDYAARITGQALTVSGG